MDAYTKAIVVRQIQAEYRAQAAAERHAAHATVRRAPAPTGGPVRTAARLVVSIVLVAVGIGGLAGAEAQLAGPPPVDGPTAGFAD